MVSYPVVYRWLHGAVPRSRLRERLIELLGEPTEQDITREQTVAVHVPPSVIGKLRSQPTMPTVTAAAARHDADLLLNLLRVERSGLEWDLSLPPDDGWDISEGRILLARVNAEIARLVQAGRTDS